MRIDRIVAAILALLATESAAQSGQNFTISPYSNFGLGELLHSNIAEAGNMGQTYSGAYSYSYTNPATLAGLRYSTLDFGMNYRYGLLSTATAKQSYFGGGLSYFSLGLPVVNKRLPVFTDSSGIKKIKKYNWFKWNMALGLYPLTTVGYNYSIENTSPFTYRTAHSGKGGINLVDFSHSFSLGKHISLGYSAGHMFGQLTDRSVVSVPDSIDLFILDDEKSVQVNGYRQQAGFMVQWKLDSTYHRLGGSYRMYSSVKASDSRFSRSYGYTNGSLTSVDTLLNTTGSKRKLSMPSGFGLGYYFQWRKKWGIGFDYYSESWTNFNAYFQTGQKLANRTDFGVSFVLNPVDEKQAKLKKMPIPVRFGYRQAQTQNVITSSTGAQTVIQESAVFAGFGIPFTRRYFDGQILRSLINVRVDYLTRGSTANGLAREEFVTATLSFNMGDVWFQRRKFD